MNFHTSGTSMIAAMISVIPLQRKLAASSQNRSLEYRRRGSELIGYGAIIAFMTAQLMAEDR